jgi:tetratricopeptide (TPR) repeat protein
VWFVRLFAVFLAGSCLALAAPAFATDTPIYAAPADWVVPSAGPLPKGDAATPWLLSDQQILIEADKRSTFSDHAYRIQSAEALRNWDDLQFVWHPDRDDLIVHKIQLLRGGQTIDLLGQGLKLTVLRRERDFEQKTIDGLLTGTASIEDLRVGDIVRFSATVVERSDVLAGNSEAMVDVQAKPASIAQGSVRVLWPRALPIKWKAFGKGIAPVEADKGSYHILTQTDPVIKQDEMPEDAPIRYQRSPGLEFSTFASWNDLSRTTAPLYQTAGTIKPGGTLAAAVDKIAKTSADPKTRAALALAFVQNEIRYLYNGLANGNYVPQTPEETWSLRYGDCKAKTMLLLAMLDKLGVAAQPALVSSQAGDLLPGRLPALGAFDHVVVQAHIGDTDYWLDGTTAGTHVDDLADVPPFRFVLPIAAAGHDLLPLPVRQPARPDITLAVTYDQSAGLAFPPLFDLAFTMRGDLAARIAGMKDMTTPDQLRDLTRRALGSFVDGGTVHTRSIEVDEAAGTATIHASGIGSLPWSRDEPRPYLNLDGLISDFEIKADRTRTAWRDIPLAGGTPSLIVHKFSLKLPPRAGYVMEGDAKADMTIAGTAMKRDARLVGNRLDQTESIWSTGADIAANQLPAARAQVAAAKQRQFQLRAPEGFPSPAEEIAAARKEKRLAPLLAAYQKAIDDDPDEVRGYLNRAAFNMEIFELRAALPDLDQAIEREGNVDTYLSRSSVYSQLGDFKKALADTDEALLLDPGSEEALGWKTSMLAEMKRFDEAIALTDEQLAIAKDKRGWTSTKANVLGKAGRAEEGVTLLTAALAERPGDANLLNELCWLKGTRSVQLDTALNDCTRAIELTDTPASVLDSRALVFYRLGRMEEARADLDAALKISPDLPASLFMRAIVRMKGNDREGAQADFALARLQHGRIDAEYAAYGIVP